MCIFIGHFGFMNIVISGWVVHIRNQRLCKLPNTEFHPNQITYGWLVGHIRSGGPSYPRGCSCSTPPPLLYIKYIIKFPNVHQKLHKRSFEHAIHR